MKRAISVILCAVLGVGMFISCQKKTALEKTVIEQSPLSPAITFETMTEAATTIVHGTVVAQGEAYVDRAPDVVDDRRLHEIRSIQREVAAGLKVRHLDVDRHRLRPGEADVDALAAGGNHLVGKELKSQNNC